MTVQLLICTFNDGILQIPNLLLAPIEGVSYLVSWQQAEGYTPCALPGELCRSDVEVHPLQGLGLSRNRNNCLRLASGDVCLICDDDCHYTVQGLMTLKSTFETHPDIDIITFKMRSDAEQRYYPATAVDLSKRVRNYSVVSFEISFRREAVAGRLRFNEHFGLGSDLFGMGEEEWFLLDAIDAGLQCRFFPIEVVEHQGLTTWRSRANEPAVLMTYGAILHRRYRATMLLRAPLIAWRMRKNGVRFTHALRHILRGIMRAQQT